MAVKILLVDDEPDILKLIGERLKKWGYGVSLAATGKEAVDIVKTDNPDIVILDYMMPDMDGIATLQEIRKIDKKVRVIMFTAYPDKKSIKTSDEYGISAYVPKFGIFDSGVESLKKSLELLAKSLNKKK